MTPTIQSITDTGTPFGTSYWLDWLKCPEYARRKSLQEKKSGLCGIEALDIGTVFHALCHLYYTADSPDALDTRLIKWTDPSVYPEDYKAKIYQEADRLFQAYRLAHSAKELGAIVAVEKFYELKDFLGVLHTFTIRPDLEVRLTKKRAEALGLPGPGIYQVDHKTWGREYGNDALYCQRELRFTLYNEACKIVHGSKFQGTIVNAIYKGRDVKFKRYFVPLSAISKQRLLVALNEAAEYEEQYAGMANLSALTRPETCANRFASCQFINHCQGI